MIKPRKQIVLIGLLMLSLVTAPAAGLAATQDTDSHAAGMGHTQCICMSADHSTRDTDGHCGDSGHSACSKCSQCGQCQLSVPLIPGRTSLTDHSGDAAVPGRTISLISFNASPDYRPPRLV